MARTNESAKPGTVTSREDLIRFLNQDLARAPISFALWKGAARCAVFRSGKIAHQHGNGVADSLPSGSGNLDVLLSGGCPILSR